MVDTKGCVCCSVGWGIAFGLEFFPSFIIVVADEGIAGDDILA